MSPPKSNKTIDQILDEFLDDQEARLSHSSFTKYETIIRLYKAYLERYWPGHEQKEYDAITKKGGTYCATFGAEDITEGFSEFLGYFMPHKVLGGTGTMKAAGTVIKKLNKWLVAKGYTEADEVTSDSVKELGRDLGASQSLLDKLTDWVEDHKPSNYQKAIEGHFWIERIEPGQLWLGSIDTNDTVDGPVPVPKAISKSCKEGWDIGAAVAKTAEGWRLLEVWNISP
jgi:hypothetical protein